MRKINLNCFLFLFIAVLGCYVSEAQVAIVNNGVTDDAIGNDRCGTMPAVLQRVATDPAYAAFYNQHIANMESGLYRSLDPCATPITIPVAFHFDDSFNCADPDCLTSEVQESIDALNAAFGDNTQNQLVQDLNTVCPAGYPLADVSTGTCITFCLAEPRAATSGEGLDAACDPAITIGSFCGGVNYGLQVDPTCDGGAPPYYSGILNVFIVADNGSGTLGIADGIPVAAANGNGVTVLGEVFGADGGGCISGGSLNTSNTFGGGATLAHEIGHYLGLFHIWGDDGGSCAGSDQIGDTPNQGDNNGALFPCPTVTPGTTTCADLPMSCGSNDYYHNFMDYTSDNCLVMFTQEQAQVMNFNANELFGNTSAECFTDPIVLTSLCEQTVCDPACDFEATITAVCDADSMNYTVTVEIVGGTGPFDVNETADNDPLTVETVLATGLTAGTYTYSFPAGTNANVVVVDNGIADCFDGQLLFDPCASCDFEIEVDYSNVTCAFNANADGNGPVITFTVINPSGIVWLDQDGNTTFDAVDFQLNPTLQLTFFPNSVTNTFTFYDGGVLNCSRDVEVLLSNYSCDGVADGDPALLNCNFKAEADLVNYNCNGDGTATVTINVENTFGNITELSGNATVDPADPATYTTTVDVGANCGLTTLTFADDGSDVSSNSGVEIISPPSIANTIQNVAYNSDDWGIDINTVTTPICSVIAQPEDGAAPETDFCEPTPPATPTAAQCANMAGNIAIIDRGLCNFTDKIENAQACGATAVIICNCLPGSPNCNATDIDEVIPMGGAPIGTITIPSVFLSYNDCQEVYAQLGQGTPVEFCIGAPMDVPCERTVNIDACNFECENTCTASVSTISTTDIMRICIDGVPDPINVTIDVDGGGTGVWVVTDPTGFVFDTYPGSPFDFDNAGPGICLIWYVNSDDPNIDFVFGDDISTVVANTPCSFLSNSIAIDRIEVTAATISTTDPLTICVDDGIDEPINVNIDNAGIGANGAWVITDASGTIVALPGAPPFILDGAGVGSCSIWWVNYDDPAFAPAVGDDAAAIVGAATCATLSNPIIIVRENCTTPCNIGASTISTTDPTRICIDGVADPINVTVDADGGATGAWVITDAAGMILALPAGPPFDLDGAGAGQCLIWYVNFDDATFAPAVGDDAAAIVAASTCAFLSNAITVDRIEVTAAAISTTDPLSICVDDGVDEPIDVTIDNAGIGANGAWVITDANGIILALPAAPPFVLDGAGVGTCLIWWVNYDDPNFAPAVGDDAAAIVGAAACATLSNSIAVVRENCTTPCGLTEGSTISTTDPTTICIDGVADPINVTIDVDAGGTGVWVITDAAGIILALPAAPPFDLDGAGAGTCLIWYANTEDGTFNPMVGDDAAAAVAASDCSFLSNSITVERIEVTGATISSPAGDPITICTNDGVDEPIDVNIMDAGIGANGAWVITDNNGIILALPAGPPFVLDGAGPGTCLIWWVNYDDANFAPAIGDDAAALVAAATCAALSNPITVNRDDNCGPCQDSIAGSVITEETGCVALDIEVTIYDASGAIVGTAITDANGDYALMGVFPCGSYTAELTANIPSCYSDSGGTNGPIDFNVDGDGVSDGAIFNETPQVPTLSQWGLISLALLLMIIGSLKMSATQMALKRFRVK